MFDTRDEADAAANLLNPAIQGMGSHTHFIAGTTYYMPNGMPTVIQHDGEPSQSCPTDSFALNPSLPPPPTTPEPSPPPTPNSPPRPPPPPPPSPPSPPPCEGIQLDPTYGSHGRSWGVMTLQVTNPEVLAGAAPSGGDLLICLVLEKVVNLFAPQSEYTGDFVSPWADDECMGEMHDTYSHMTLNFTEPKDG